VLHYALLIVFLCFYAFVFCILLLFMGNIIMLLIIEMKKMKMK